MVDEPAGHAQIRRLTDELAQVRARYGRGSSQGLEAFHRLVAAYAADGRRIDELRRYEPDETKRFFTFLLQGADGHAYWNGGASGFKRNDGGHQKPVWWWWERVYGFRPSGLLAQTCGEPRCVNPRHAAEVPRGMVRLYPEHVIIGALQAWALAHNGEAPSMHRWDGTPSHTVVKHRFGSWSNALRAAGLPAAPHNVPRTRSEALCAVRFVAGMLGHLPSHDEYRAAAAALRERGYPTSPATVRRHFGVWADVLAAAASDEGTQE